MKNLSALLSSKKQGFTLVEVIICIALLALISAVFLQLFTMSAQITGSTENKLDATYDGKNTMELMYQLSVNTDYEDIEDELTLRGFSKSAENIYLYETPDKKHIELKFAKTSGDLVRVTVKVYNDSGRTKLEAQYEAYYLWNGEGESDEG